MADPRDVEDVLQDVFSELVEANRRLMPIDDVAGWLFRAARNRITDLFRKMQPDSFSETAGSDDEILQFGEPEHWAGDATTRRKDAGAERSLS